MRAYDKPVIDPARNPLNFWRCERHDTRQPIWEACPDCPRMAWDDLPSYDR